MIAFCDNELISFQHTRIRSVERGICPIVPLWRSIKP